jgi:hypothetical protein
MFSWFSSSNDNKSSILSYSSYRDSKKRLNNIFTRIIQVNPSMKEELEKLCNEEQLMDLLQENINIDFNKKYTFDDIQKLTQILTNTVPLSSKSIINMIENKNKLSLDNNPDKVQIIEIKNTITKKISYLDKVIKLLKNQCILFIDEKKITEEKCKLLEEDAEKNKDKIELKKEKIKTYELFLNACEQNIANFEKTLDNIRDFNNKDPKENQQFTTSNNIDMPSEIKPTKKQSLADFLKKKKYASTSQKIDIDDDDEMKDYNNQMQIIKEKQKKQDDILILLHHNILHIQEQAKTIGSELDIQCKKLENLDSQMDKQQTKLQTLNKNITKLLSEKSKGMCMLYFVGCILIVCIVIFFVVTLTNANK